MSSELLKQAKRIGAWYWLATGKQEVSLDLLLLPLETAQAAIELLKKNRNIYVEKLNKLWNREDEQKKRLQKLKPFLKINCSLNPSWEYCFQCNKSFATDCEKGKILVEVFGENASEAEQK